ncbi:MAG: hypothetical protein JXL97_18685 [Bacteroidales bacterium]|nr:hypothetical protein [Bacteroidales bacterium]
MKTTLTFLLLFFTLTVFSQKYTSPIDYNDAIVDLQIKIYDKLDTLENQMFKDDVNEKSCNKARKEVIKTTKKAIKTLNKISDFDGDDKFQKSGMELFKSILDVLNNEYAVLIKLYSKPLEEFTSEDDVTINETWIELDEKIIKTEDVFLSEQEKFAENHGFILY